MRERRRIRRGGATALVVTGAMLLSGCVISNPFDDKTSSTSSAAPAPVPSGQQALARYYQQKLTWTKCGNDDCTRLTVPLDYANPGGQDIQLSVLRVPARKQGQRIGSLLVNPGGPGGSGVDYAKYADFIVGAPVRQRFDVVGFDPRGVGRSAPIECLDPPALDNFLGQDPTPDDAAEQQQAVTEATDFGKACQQRNGALLGHVSTVDAAKDMDVLRSALGDQKLYYLGKSYGTFLGATYAGLFPTTVGRMVLDGALAPDLTPEEVALGQAKGFEVATKAWAQDCIDGGSCPLGSSVDQVMTGLSDLLTKLDATPAPVHGDARITSMSEGWASLGVAAAMYDQGMWDSLTRALRDLVHKDDGTSLMGLADQYADRNLNGSYSGNMMQAIYAVNCLDASDSADPKVYAERAVRFTREAPLFGRFLAWSGLTCGHWPVPATGKPHRITAAGSPPIVVVGTTRDPATPYDWAVRLADQLQAGVLVTYDGDGHTAYTRSNSCIDKAIDTYYVSGTAPQDGLRC